MEGNGQGYGIFNNMTNICMVIVTAPACSARSVSSLVQNLSPRVVGLSQKADSDDDVKPPKDVPKLLSGRKKPKNKTNVCVCGCERYQGKGSQLSTNEETVRRWMQIKRLGSTGQGTLRRSALASTGQSIKCKN